MKMPLVENMRTAKTGEVKALTPHMTSVHALRSATDVAAPLSSYAILVSTKVTFGMDQWAREDTPLEVLHEKAVHVMLREVYGPVEARLFDILTMLWEAGPVYDDKVAQAVNQLLNDMRP